MAQLYIRNNNNNAQPQLMNTDYTYWGVEQSQGGGSHNATQQASMRSSPNPTRQNQANLWSPSSESDGGYSYY